MKKINFNIWQFAGTYILTYRKIIVLLLAVVTVFLGFFARRVHIAYELPRFLPDNDSANILYEQFKSRFGIDGAVLVIAFEDSNFFLPDKFSDYYDLTYSIKNITGIQEVISAARLFHLVKNDSLRKFEFLPLLSGKPSSGQELDSLAALIHNLPFYRDFIYTVSPPIYVMAVTFAPEYLNSRERLDIVDTIRTLTDEFAGNYQLKPRYSGLPYIRTEIARTVLHEMVLFTILAIIVTAVILFLFFRSGYAVIFPLLVALTGVVWALGMVVLCGYKITILSGLIPPLLIVIGVPNSILLLNKYHFEYSQHGDQKFSLFRMIEKIGPSLFLANFTTAIGFGVFCLTNSRILFEFGLIASVNVMATYAISMHLIPIIFSYLPPPSVKHTRHLTRSRLAFALETVDRIAHRKRNYVYTAVIGTTLLSAIGITQIDVVGYVVDDLPGDHPIYSDLHFFQEHLGGVMPFEITIDTKKPGGALKDRTLRKINKLHKLIGQYDEFSRPLSVVEAIKFSNQAYHEGNPKHYILPNSLDLAKIAQYSSEAKEKQSRFKAFLDSTRQHTRISVQMADIGSQKMKDLVNEITPRIDSVFNYDAENKIWIADSLKCDVVLTGNSIMFLKGNDFLVENLIESVLLAIVLISIVMYSMFMSYRMTLVALLPSSIPLVVTAGLMGFSGIHLKPSTILIFSIAFGIASDGTLYFLTKYKQEFINHQRSISRTVTHVIGETGISMIYTAIILACGFAIFAASEFGGTIALGILISLTLLMAYCSNLILLPSLLLSMNKRLTKKALLQEPLIQLYDEEEDIELERLTVPGAGSDRDGEDV